MADMDGGGKVSAGSCSSPEVSSPARASASEDVAERGEPFGYHGAVDPAADLLLGDQPGVGEQRELVRHSRLAFGHGLLEVTAGGCRSSGPVLWDGGDGLATGVAPGRAR